MKLSIKAVLILGVIGLQSITVGAILLSSYTSSEETLLRLGRDRMAEVATQITKHFEELLLPVANIAGVSQGLFRQDVLSADDHPTIESYLLEMMDLVPWMSGIYVGRPDGSFVFVKRDNEKAAQGYRTKIIEAGEASRRVSLIWRDRTFVEVGRADDPEDTYDPRARPWYQRAIDTGGRIWTDPYIFYTSQLPGITVAEPVVGRDGTILGVVGVDIEIAEFSVFLQRQQIAEHGKAMVLTRSGNVIAHPDPAKITRPGSGEDASLRFTRIDELDDPVSRGAVQSLSASLEELKLDEPVFTSFDLEGVNYLSSFMTFPGGRWPWIITVLVPADDFLGAIKQNRLYNIYAAIAIGIAACAIGALLARGIARPMAALARAADTIKERRYDVELPTASPISDVAATLSAFHDMTQSLQAEAKRNAELTEGLRKFSRAVEQSPAAIFITDAGGVIEYANPACLTITGFGAEQVIGATPRFLGASNLDEADYAKLQVSMSAGQTWRRELQCRDSSGMPLLLGTLIAPVRGADGQVSNWIGLAEDITERRYAEGQLQQAQKMEVVGQLTGGLAHDYNNLLSVILGNLEILQRRLADNAMAENHIDMALRAGRRSATLTQRLLAFSRRQPLTPELSDVNEVIEGMDDLLRQTLDESIELELDLADDLWYCVVDHGQLENALLNLAINARDAMPRGGRLTIETANLQVVADESGPHRTVPPGDYVHISVHDNGEGMPPDVVARAFEPFFTTKGLGRGTGLGLSSIYGFVKQSGGHVKLCSKPGEGTTVRLYLPMAAEEASAALDFASESPDYRGSGERVLIVEDDDDVRTTTADMLSELGYEVVLCDNGANALKRLAGKDGIDLLLTDIVLAGELSGFDLAREAKACCPDIKVVCMSGYAKSAAGAMPPGELPLLAKPFTQEELGRLVHEALNGAGRETVAG